MRRQWWTYNLSCFIHFKLFYKKPPTWGLFFKENRLIHYLLSLCCISIPKFFYSNWVKILYLNIYSMQSDSSGVWVRKGTASGFATICWQILLSTLNEALYSPPFSSTWCFLDKLLSTLICLYIQTMNSFFKWRMPRIFSRDVASTTLWTFLHKKRRNPFKGKPRCCLQHDSDRLLPYLDTQIFGIPRQQHGALPLKKKTKLVLLMCKHQLIPTSKETEMSTLRMLKKPSRYSKST